MGFDKKYPNRKDWRKPYRGSKAVDASCRNHGDCPHCRDSRLRYIKIGNILEEEQKELIDEESNI